MDNENKTKHGIVETYAEDMAKALEDDKGGLIKKVIHGEEEHEKEKIELSPESKKNKFFMLTGLIFIFLSLLTFSYFFLLNQNSPTVPVEEQFTPLIFTDTSTSIETAGLKKDKIIQSVFNFVLASKVKTGGVEGIYLLNNDKRDIGLREFIALIKGNFAPNSDRLLINDRFLMGVVNTGTKLASGSGGGDFFILLKMRSTADIFDSLRSWERKMFFDLHGFFGFNISSETNYLLTKDFSDGIIKNKNARILYDKDNKIVFMYIFADDNSVIITNTESAGEELMLRLAASQVKK